MELWLRAIQACCNLEACKSDDPKYREWQSEGQYYPRFIWEFWITRNQFI